MKKVLNKNPLVVSMLALGLGFTSSTYAQFDNIVWTPNTENTPSQDKSGSGETPSTDGATNNNGTFTFRISTNNSSSTQRQEFRYENMSGYNQLKAFFTISPDEPDFDKISFFQNHDFADGSSGVFSIYQVRRNGDGYVFGVQGDTTDAENGYSTFSNAAIELGKEYEITINSFVSGVSDSVEVAELYDNGQLVWSETVSGGGPENNTGYYKLGAC